MNDLPAPPRGARNLVLVVLDSLRYDTWVTARPRTLSLLGGVEQRFSYATWTAPSHYNLLMGLLPHANPRRVYASEYYKQDYIRFGERLGVEGIEFRKLLPSIFLPAFLRNSLGYRTRAMVSMPVLNPHTAINRDFDSFELMPKHNDMAAMVDQLVFEEDRPTFHLLNVGETHYPYAPPDEDPGNWPRISGVHGVVKRLGPEDGEDGGATGHHHDDTREFFDQTKLDELRSRQVNALNYLDEKVFPALFDKCPSGTWIIVTSDHGELFGEGDFFGHGPVMHEKVFEVPFVEGIVP